MPDAGLAIMGQIYSGALNSIANNVSKNAINYAVNKEVARQKGWTAQGNSLFEQNLAATSPEKQQASLSKKANTRVNSYNAAQVPLTSSASLLPVSGMDAFRSNILRALMNRSRANYAAWGENEVQRKLQNSGVNDMFGVINNLSAGSAPIGSAEAYQAQFAGDKLRMIASIIGSMSKAGSTL